MSIVQPFFARWKLLTCVGNNEFFIVQLLKLQLHGAIYRLRFYSNSLIHILSLSNSHNNVASIQKNQDYKSHHVIVALGFFYITLFHVLKRGLSFVFALLKMVKVIQLGYNYTVRFIAPILLY